ncbi:MAG: hypothetical protein NZM39_12410, partial [Bernardetiaceae bacterium]|nr:hypothetical protein [Bernardetiaceae bacterium]
QTRNRIARITTSGAVDSWDPNANNSVHAIVATGSEVYVGGAFTQIGGASRHYLAKVGVTSHAADAAWNPNPNHAVHALVLAGTDLYAGGLFTSIGAQPRNRIAKLSTTGTGAADPAWHPDAEGGGAFALALHGTTLYAGGSFTNIGGIPFGRLARIQKSNKEIDPTWNPNANNTVLAIAVSGSDVYVGGDFTQVGGQARNRIAKLSASGAGAA